VQCGYKVSEHKKIKNIINGDLKSFEVIFKQYYAPLVRYGFTILKNTEESEDVVQQVFVTLWQKIEEIEFTISIKSYLYKMVHNHCLNKLKHEQIKQKHATEVLHIQHSLSYQEHPKNELLKQIDLALESLPEQCGRIFKMSRYDGMKYQEIANELGLSIKTIENQMGKALKIMREKLKDFLPLFIILFL
jgi:RNA polymerase sigma-70 factor (ECF subfamily)